MFSFGKKRKARNGARAALLAGAVVAVSVLGAAGSASAEPSCTGSKIIGQGASFQKVAQLNVWLPDYTENICPGAEVEYLATGSGSGLAAWNFDGVSGTINTARQFTSSDDAPSPAQIKNARLATTGKLSTAANVLTMPVTQAAITISANPPAGCTIEAIQNVELEEVFRGTVLSWDELATAAGGAACESPITRVVRLDGSGTTYQFKNYLTKINGKGVLPCTGGKVWKELLDVPTPNITWPESCEATTLSPLLRGKKNGNASLIERLNETSGSIGYSALSDAKIGKAPVILSLQNNGKTTKKPTYAKGWTGELSNCGTAVYTVPKPAREGEGTGLNANWSKVFGAKISTVKAGGGYPLCTLTFSMAFDKYSKVPGFTESQVTAVKDYLAEYVVAEAGQEAIETTPNTWYAPLPESVELKHDVLGAARYAASKIGF
jgi:ABC-type phosphate transport system substrate-binding protein